MRPENSKAQRKEISSQLQGFARSVRGDTLDDADFEVPDFAGTARPSRIWAAVRSSGKVKGKELDQRFRREVRMNDDPITPFVEDQLDDFASGVDKPFVSSVAEELFDNYRTSAAFASVVAEFIRRVELGLSVDLGRMSGRMFADIAFSFLSYSLPEDTLLLSQKHTLDLYSSLKPYVKLSPKPYGLDSLEGISVADGVFITQSKRGRYIVRKTVEYSLDIHDDLRGKADALDRNRELFPHVFHPRVRMHLVMPEPSGDGETIPPSMTPENTTVLPFSGIEFSLFRSHVINATGIPMERIRELDYGES